MGKRTSLVAMLVAVLLLMTGTGTLQAQSPEAVQYRLVEEALGSVDGTIELRSHLLTLRDGRWIEVEGERPMLRARDDLPYQDLLVQNMHRWRNSANVVLSWTREMKKYLKEVETFLNKLVNRRRGHPSIPKYSGPKRKAKFRVGVKILDTPEQTKRQKNFSDTNDLTKTDDNRFFHGERKDIVSRTVRMTTYFCSPARGSGPAPTAVDQICDRHITEGDIHFSTRNEDQDRLDFFEDVTKFNRQRQLVFSGKFLHGQDSSAWAHHFLGTWDEVSQKALRRNTSRSNKESRSIDKALYTASRSNNGPARIKPVLLPSRDTVIYLNDLRPEFDDRQTFSANAFARKALVYTSLGGFNNKKRMQLDIKDAGRFDPESPEERSLRPGPVVRVRGFTIDRNVTFSDGVTTGIETHLMSRVSIGDEDAFDDLARFMCRNGRSTTVNGVGYDFVRRIRVIIKGHPDPRSGRKRASSTYIAAYDEEDEEDDRSCENLLEDA